MTLPSEPFRVVHIGDLHFWHIPLNPLLYSGKRLLGVGNLVWKRRKQFRTTMGHLLVEKLEQLKPFPNAFLFSGDFSTTALEEEFLQARTLLQPTVGKAPLGAHAVPGNHDCYSGAERAGRSFLKTLTSPFQAENAVSLRHLAPGVSLLAINGTTNNGLLDCYGGISPEILQRAGELLTDLTAETRHLWILCHFPPEEPTPIVPHQRGLQLRGAEPLLALLRNVRAQKLWLHGHHHYRWIYTSPTVEGLVYLNAGAPFLRHGKTLPDLGFHEIIVEGEDWRVRTHATSENGSRWIVKDPDIPPAGEFIDLQKS